MRCIIRSTIFIALNICLLHGFPNNHARDSRYPFPFFTRDNWGGQTPTDVRPLTKPVPYVVIHHTYLPSACSTTEDCSAAMRSMQQFHNSMGWGDIGYNFCVGSEGGAYEGRGWDTIGIHAGRANNVSIGICLIGDWRDAIPPQQMLETTKALISVGVERGVIRPSYKLVGHKQIMATECPGAALFNIISTWDHFSNDLSELNSQEAPAV